MAPAIDGVERPAARQRDFDPLELLEEDGRVVLRGQAPEGAAVETYRVDLVIDDVSVITDDRSRGRPKPRDRGCRGDPAVPAERFLARLVVDERRDGKRRSKEPGDAVAAKTYSGDAVGE